MTGSREKRHVQAEAQRKADETGLDMALFSRYTVEHGRRVWAFCANAGLPGREWRFESWAKPTARTVLVKRRRRPDGWAALVSELEPSPALKVIDG